ncbi:MAG TPA: TonB-dependent receptor [Verrucomicrobiae bacterium]|jgi:Tfp pilus assembly protein PilF
MRVRAAFTAVALLCFLACIGSALADGAAPSQNDVRIVEIQGGVEVSPAGATTWAAAHGDQVLHAFDRLRTGTQSRVAFRWANQSVMTFGASTELEILPPHAANADPGLHLIRGIVSFFHRDEPSRIRIITRGAVAGVEGTDFVLAVNETERTILSVIDGAVKFSNDQAALVLTNGQQAVADAGHAPVRTEGFVANNILQWCFYYPAVLDLEELPLTADEQQTLSESLAAYRAGDLPQALARYPAARQAGSDGERVYYAALLLSVGQAGEAQTLLSSPSLAGAGERFQHLSAALQELISAVKRQSNPAISNPQLATEFLAASYYEQSRALPKVSLKTALNLARHAAQRSAHFGFAWERVAELEFCFGHKSESLKALNKSLEISPRNAQALALKGFLLAARNQTREATGWFDQALAVDSSLGNAWLGRGLARIRLGDGKGGREDLLVAAALEPQRAELRSYLGKAFASGQDYRRANKELQLAKDLDPNDPTAWLYSALLNQLDNNINDAVRDLEKSEALNDNRRVYRSQFLLDQDRAVRSANLAAMYQDAGMTAPAIREALRAVNDNYGNYSAHLFLADSYSRLVDPYEINLRYETAMENEFLLANLLSPAAVGPMSQTVSEQDYARLFERNRLGFTSDTEYLSRGSWNSASAQYGVEKNFSWNVEEDYYADPGQSQRVNNGFEQKQFTLTVKQQLTPRDSIYGRILDYDADGGDTHQYYDSGMANSNFHFRETQQPTAVIGYHHEGDPGVHTLFLAGRINDDASIGDLTAPTLVVFTPAPGKFTLAQGVNMNEVFENQLTVYSSELQQIWETPEHNTIIGGRGQYGDFETLNFQDAPSTLLFNFPGAPAATARQDVDLYFERASAYAYHQWQVADPLQLIAGVTYDWMRYPDNWQMAPVSTAEQSTSAISPKAGFILTPAKNTTIRFAFTRSVGGASVDQSYQIEPSQVAGFIQSFRSLIPESSANESPGATFETFGFSVEQKFNTGTYLGIEGDALNSRDHETAGDFDVTPSKSKFGVPSELSDQLEYHEETLQLTANQLAGRDWSFGAAYQVTKSMLNENFTQIPNSLAGPTFQPRRNTEGVLHQVGLSVNFNHPSGFFARGEAVWNGQSNSGYSPNEPGDDFWQLNAYLGYRFLHRAAELRLGLLNITSQDYQLNPLNLHQEYPHTRTLALRLRLNF